MVKRKFVLVDIKGSEFNGKGRITREKWTIKGKKKYIFVVRDKNNKKLARSIHIKSFGQAKDKFERLGSFNERRKVNFFVNNKQIIQPVYRKGSKKMFMKKEGDYQITTTIYLPNGKKIERSSNKYHSGTDFSIAQKEADDRAFAELSKEFGSGYDSTKGKNIAKLREIQIKHERVYWKKR